MFPGGEYAASRPSRHHAPFFATPGFTPYLAWTLPQTSDHQSRTTPTDVAAPAVLTTSEAHDPTKGSEVLAAPGPSSPIRTMSFTGAWCDMQRHSGGPILFGQRYARG